MSDYVLYSYYRSSCSWRVRLVLELKGIVYVTLPVNLLENEQLADGYVSLNPSGSVPALIDRNSTRLALTQSVAIMEFLEERHPETLRLLPRDPETRAHVRRLVQIIAADCQPLQNLHVLRRLATLADRSDEQVRAEWGRFYIERALDAFVRFLDGPLDEFCCGPNVSLADVVLVPQLYNARRFGIDVETRYPRLAAIERHFQSVHPEAFSRAHPDNQ